MNEVSLPRSPCETGITKLLTLADIAVAISRDEHLSPSQMSNMCSAIRSLCRALNVSPADAPASLPGSLREPPDFIRSNSAWAPSALPTSSRRSHGLSSIVSQVPTASGAAAGSQHLGKGCGTYCHLGSSNTVSPAS